MKQVAEEQNTHPFHALKMKWYDTLIKIFGADWFFNYQRRSQERAMIRQYYQIAPSLKSLEPCVVFTCNGFTWSGGLADRIKGIISTYDWCQQNGRTFKINFCEPFRLEDYLVPNKYDWLPNDVAYKAQNVLPRICLREPRTGKYLAPKWDSLFPKWMNQNVNDESIQYHLYTNMFLSYYDFPKRFHELFKPCERLQKEIDFHLQNIGAPYISISFRFTTLLGDFTDCTGAPLPEDEQKDLIERSLNVVHEIASHAPVHDKILITADSEKFLSRVQDVRNVYVIPGKVGHIDYDHGDDVNMKTFLDFFMISKAEKVYLAKGSQMYNSAFAKTAAMVNNKPFEIYKY